MDDNLYPNDGTYFIPEVPEETKRSLTAEQKRAYDAQPFIADVISWFDEVIKATNEVSAVKQEAARRKTSIEVAVEAYDITRELLEQKRGELISLAKTLE